MRKKTLIVGSVSTAAGGIGTILGSLGLCACFWGPILSLAGVTSVLIGFFTKFTLIFIIIGVVLIIFSLIFHKDNCKVHYKKKSIKKK